MTVLTDIVRRTGRIQFFHTAGDGYYSKADNIDVHSIHWAEEGLDSVQGADANETYIVEYLGDEAIPGESKKEGTTAASSAA